MLAWAGLGLLGSALVALAGTDLLGAGAPSWWYSLGGGSHAAATVALYAGMALLALGWLGLGRLVGRPDGPSLALLAAIGFAWCLPQLLGPPLFSRDVYSYLAQGTLLHLGHNPYQVAPIALGPLGHGHVLSAVSPFWRQTISPYGPLFLGLVSLIVSVTGAHLVAGVLAVRVLDLVGLGLIAVFLPRLARRLGADPPRALWLGALSPLVLLELVAPAHNDLLMAGLMVAGVAFAMERRPLAGIALCALAATIKLPALLAVAFIVAALAREMPAVRARRFGAGAVLSAAVVLVAVTVAVGVGFAWVSTAVFSTPQKVHLAITPGTAVGWTIASVLNDFGVHAGHRALASAFGLVTFALAVTIAGALLWRACRETLVPYLGWALWAVALGGPAAWAWYLIWGVVLLAACPAPQRSRALALTLAATVFLVKPDGILALPVGASPVMVAVYAGIAAAAWRWWRPRPGGVSRADRGNGVAGSHPSALVGS